MKFEALIFDFDGVIVDSEVVTNAALADVLTSLGHPTSAQRALELYSGLRWSDCCRAIERDAGRAFDPEALGGMVDEAIAGRVADVLAIEGLEPFLLSQAHRPLAIASSSEQAWLDSSLERLGLTEHFRGRVYSASGFARGKPHPDVYLHVAAELGVPPSACLVIEDHPVGVAAGASAGMTVIALLAASHIGAGHAGKVRAAGAHHIARDYVEVAEILARLEQA